MAIHELGVPLVAQKTPYWCWAASVEMVLAYHGAKTKKAPPKQCKIASVNDQNQGKLDCCKKKNRQDSACRASNPQEALDYFGPQYGVSLAQYAGNKKITFESIQQQIDAKQPFIATWIYPSDSRPLGVHSIVVIGYQVIDGKRFVIINNPAPVCVGSRCTISYECFSKQYVANLYCALPPDFSIVQPPAPLKAKLSTLDVFQQIAIQRARARVDDGHRVGAPLPVFEIMMHEVAQETERTVERLGSREDESTHVIYPVLADQRVVTTFEVRRTAKSSPTKDPTWNLCCIGGDDLYHRLSSVAARCRLKPEHSFALSEPALGMWFVGGERKGIKLVPISDVQDVGLKEGSELSVNELAEKLRSYALD